MSKKSLAVEYVSPDHEASVDVQSARYQVIEATRKACPAFLRTLRDKVFPIYAKAPKNDRGELFPLGLRTVEDAISKWAKGFNADRDWIKEQALETLGLWMEFEENRKKLTWGRWGYMLPPGGSTGKDFEFQYPPWISTIASWAEYRKAARDACEKALDDYEGTVRGKAELAGLRRGRRTYSHDHIRWLALHVFAKLDYEKIANLELSGNAGAYDKIRKGVRAAAELVGWPLIKNSSGK